MLDSNPPTENNDIINPVVVFPIPYFSDYQGKRLSGIKYVRLVTIFKAIIY
jgi:hypothetical protein